jgi:hypothetical protein
VNEFERVVNYGKPMFRGLNGSVWQHRCGNIMTVELIDRVEVPWLFECAGCRGRGSDGWYPLYAYTGPLCDQCHGNGWVPISGKNDGALCGYDTVTECTACGATGTTIQDRRDS